MYPFAEQILAYKAADKEKRIGGLILEVKGDFCRKVKEILDASRARRGLHRNQPRFRIPLQPASQRPRRLRAGLQHRVASEQSVRQRQGTLLAAGVHQPRQVHHPSSQGRLRLRHPLRCLRVRHLAAAPRRDGFDEAEEIILGRHYVAVTPKVLWRAHRRSRGPWFRARPEGRPLPRAGYAASCGRYLRMQRHSIRGPHRPRPGPGRSRQARTTGSRQALVP